MNLYRLSLDYFPHAKQWRVYKSWRVNADWADRVIDLDRRHSPKLRLRLLGTYPHPKGRIVSPRGILRMYWEARRRARHDAFYEGRQWGAA